MDGSELVIEELMKRLGVGVVAWRRSTATQQVVYRRPRCTPGGKLYWDWIVERQNCCLSYRSQVRDRLDVA